MGDRYTNFTGSISKINKLVQRIKSYEIGKYGLQPIHVSCGYHLSKNPQGLTAKELCELTFEDKAAISRALKAMHEKGYVKYVPGGRNEVVKLTQEGKALAEIIAEHINTAVEVGCVDITDEERKIFYESLMKISNNLIEYYQKLITSEDKK